jgi:uncharacterized protein (DUF2062 family)
MALKITSTKFYKYLYLRLIRQSDSPHALSLSVSIGIFFGLVIPIFQMFFAILFAWIFRVNKIVAAGCTWVSNPLTYAFIFPINIYIGGFFIDTEFDWETLKSIKISTIFKDFKEVLYFFFSDGMLMFMIGGAIIGLVVASLSYTAVFYTITKHKKDKEERFFKRRKAVKEKTGASS